MATPTTMTAMLAGMAMMRGSVLVSSSDGAGAPWLSTSATQDAWLISDSSVERIASHSLERIASHS